MTPPTSHSFKFYFESLDGLEGLEGLTPALSHIKKCYFEGLDGLESLKGLKGLTPPLFF